MKASHICELNIGELSMVGGGKKSCAEENSCKELGLVEMILGFAGLAVGMLGTVIISSYMYNRFNT